MKQRMKLVGAKRFKGQIDGQHFDFCKLRFLVPVMQGGDESGFGMIEVEHGSSANYDHFVKLSYPMEADVELAMVMRGKKTVHEIVSITPLGKQTNA